MKRGILCAFSFLLILLVFLTLISPKVEEEMTTLVDARSSTKGYGNLVISNIAVTWKNSTDRVFSVVEGNGWERGERLSEIPSEYFDRYPGHVELGRGTFYRYVYSASREPILGSRVRDVETYKAEDTYLLWHPDALCEGEVYFFYALPNSMSLSAYAESCALVECRSATFPFFEHNVWYTFQTSPANHFLESPEQLRVYSMHDVEQFMKCLPFLAGVAAILLCSFLLCGASWCFCGKGRGGRKLLVINISLILLLLIALPILLSLFDMPASLMPERSILDIPHYAEELGRINTSMDALGDTRVREWQSRAVTESAVILIGSVAVCGMLAVFEGLSVWRARRAAEAHAA